MAKRAKAEPLHNQRDPSVRSSRKPLFANIEQWFAELDRLREECFLDERNQPITPRRKVHLS
jgi:hypothetical protein